MRQTLKRVRYTALAMKVIAVAKEGAVGDWAAYIDAVEGQTHSLEAKQVMKTGTKLDYKIARVIFPEFDRQFAWRS